MCTYVCVYIYIYMYTHIIYIYMYIYICIYIYMYLGNTSNSLIFITISTVLSSWAPPEFSCPYFINYMKITVFISIVTTNGLLNSLIFSFFLKIPNYRKNKENMNSLFFITIPHCFELWGCTDAHVFSIEIFKELCTKRTCENI